jgi:glycine cleavage system H protein
MEGDIATVGITPFAQEKLGDLVFVELPSVGAQIEKGAVAATVESVKAASDVYAPVAGEVIAINDKVTEQPGVVNSEPTGNGWLFKMKPADPAEVEALLDEGAYNELTAAADRH